MNRIEEVLKSGIKQKDLAEKLGVAQSVVSDLKHNRLKPSKRIERLLEEIYFKPHKEHLNPRIEAIIKLLEQLPENDLEDIQKSVSEKKQLRDYIAHQHEKVAA